MSTRFKALICAALVGIGACIGIAWMNETTEANAAVTIDFTEEQSAMPCVLVEDKQIPLYSVDGAILDEDLQRYIFKLCKRFGLPEEIYPLWLAEIYAESRFDQTANNGKDYGLCQIRVRYAASMLAGAGMDADADIINDPYANVTAGTWYFADCYRTVSGNHELAMKRYYNAGSDEANNHYVVYVKSFFDKIERIN